MFDFYVRLIKSFVTTIDELSIAIHEQSDAMRKNTEATKEAIKQQEEQPPLPRSLSVDFDKTIAVSVQGETQAKIKNSWDWRDYVRLLAELVGLGILIWYACTTYRLWEESQRQTGVSINSSRMDQRAWMAVRVETVNMISGVPLSVQVNVDNVGKTPATHIFAYVVPNVLRANEMPAFRYEPGFPRIVSRTGILFPEEKAMHNVFGILPKISNGDIPPKPFIPTVGDILNLANQRIRVTVSGQLWYDDVFGVHHWVKFCKVSGIGGNADIPLIGCADYNSVDDEQEYPNTSKPFNPPAPVPLAPSSKK